MGAMNRIPQIHWKHINDMSVMLYNCLRITFHNTITGKRDFSRSSATCYKDDGDEDYEIEDFHLCGNRNADMKLGYQNVFVLQPNIYVPKSSAWCDTTVDLQLAEAVALVDCIPDWNVTGTLILPTSTPKERSIFRGERLKKLTRAIAEHQETSALFISMDRINLLQKELLAKETKIETIFDRYTLVLQIFRLRAQTKQAKLQVALAEIPYVRANLKSEILTYNRQGGGSRAVGPGEKASELLMRRFRTREQRLKKKLELLRKRRSQQREGRKRSQLPVVAVVGYTNAGKTTLIKALSKSQRLSPKDQLFATLDVTTHTAVTNCNMKYLLVDTVGFLSNLPHSLIDAFSATMEDMLQADIILHVTDISHPDYVNQNANVHRVLRDLKLPDNLRTSMIEVQNKVDLLDNGSDIISVNQDHFCQKSTDKFAVSCTLGVGLENLDEALHNKLAEVTGCRNVRVKVPASGDHLNWFGEYATVSNYVVDGDYHFIIDVTITDGMWNKFKATFRNYDVVD